MVDSPKKSSPRVSPRSKDERRRPSTPHPTARPFDFDGGVGDTAGTPHSSAKEFDFASVDNDNDYPPTDGGCIGISLAAVMNTIRGQASSTSLPTSPLSVHEGDDNLIHRFQRLRTAVQRSLTCSTKVGRQNSNYMDERYVSFDCDTPKYERERSLMQRAASWGTLETELHSSSSDRKESPSNQQVQFHYPPITSVRLRPRTRSEDVHQLFFAPEELDEIEDDRSDTKAADDIETLVVGGEGMPYLGDAIMASGSSSVVTASASYDDDQDSRSVLMLAGYGASIMFTSPKKKEAKSPSRRLVRGVQIMLREKSTG